MKVAGIEIGVTVNAPIWLAPVLAGADFGLRVIEMHASMYADMTDEEKGRLHRRILDAGLRVGSIHCRFRAGHDLACPDPALRRRAEDLLRSDVETAGEWGADHVVVHPGEPLTSRIPRSEAVRRAAEAVARLAPVAESAGVALAVENLIPTYPGDRVSELDEILAFADSDVVGILIDTGHVNVTPGLEIGEVVRHFGKRILSFHIHDNCGDDDSHDFPGRGGVDWASFWAAVREIGFAGTMISEAKMAPDMTPETYFRELVGFLEGLERDQRQRPAP